MGREEKLRQLGVLAILVGLVILGGCETGKVPPALRASHIVFMLGGLGLLLLAGTFGALCLFGRRNHRRVWLLACVGFVCIFVGGIPLGMATAYFKYGKIWVWDLTDNKTVVILMYWAVALLVTRRAGFGKAERADKFLPWLAVIGAVATTTLYLLPH